MRLRAPFLCVAFRERSAEAKRQPVERDDDQRVRDLSGTDQIGDAIQRDDDDLGFFGRIELRPVA